MFGHLYRRAIASSRATGVQIPLAKPLLRALVRSGHLQLGEQILLVGQDAPAFATFFEWFGMRCACCLDPTRATDSLAEVDTELWIARGDELAPQNYDRFLAALAPASRRRGLVILDAPRRELDSFLRQLPKIRTSAEQFAIHQYPGGLCRALVRWRLATDPIERTSALVLAPLAYPAAVPRALPTRKAA